MRHAERREGPGKRGTPLIKGAGAFSAFFGELPNPADGQVALSGGRFCQAAKFPHKPRAQLQSHASMRNSLSCRPLHPFGGLPALPTPCVSRETPLDGKLVIPWGCVHIGAAFIHGDRHGTPMRWPKKRLRCAASVHDRPARCAHLANGLRRKRKRLSKISEAQAMRPA